MKSRHYLLVVPSTAITLENASDCKHQFRQTVSCLEPQDKLIIIADVLDYGYKVASQVLSIDTHRETAVALIEAQNQRYRKMFAQFHMPFIVDEFLDRALQETKIKRKGRKWEIAAKVMEHYCDLTHFIFKQLYQSVFNVSPQQFPIETVIFKKLRLEFSSFISEVNEERVSNFMKDRDPKGLIVVPSIGKNMSGIGMISGENSISDFEKLFTKCIDDLCVLQIGDSVLVK